LEKGADEGDIKIAAALTLRYSRAAGRTEAAVIVTGTGETERTVTVAPADDEATERYRIA
jgi:hypothetical protein